MTPRSWPRGTEEHAVGELAVDDGALEHDLDVIAARCRCAQIRRDGGDMRAAQVALGKAMLARFKALRGAAGRSLLEILGDRHHLSQVEIAVLAVVTAPLLRADCASLLGSLGSGGAIDLATIGDVLDGIAAPAELAGAIAPLAAAGLIARRAAGALVAGPAAVDALLPP